MEARNLPQEQRLRLTWSDGHSAEFDHAYLRGWCPCAGCQGHGGLTLRYHSPPGPVSVGSVQAVGNYAISLAFSDGHSTGIYRFDLLRRICPCAECTGAAAGSGIATRTTVELE